MVEWHIICMTNESYERRTTEFLGVIKRASHTCAGGITGEIFDVPDGYAQDTVEDDPKMERFLEAVNNKLTVCDVLISHGENGEYGHDDHCTVSKLCRKLITRRAFEIPWLTFQPLTRETSGDHQLGSAEIEFKRSLLRLYSQKQVFTCGMILPYVNAEKLDTPKGRTISSEW